MAIDHTENGKLLSAAAILFALTLIAGTVPVHLIEFISRRFGNKQENKPKSSSFWAQLKAILTKDLVVQFLGQLGGGVLLYTALIHMLPEIRENYENYLKDKNDTSTNSTNGEAEDSDAIPLVDYCACAGFLGIFLIEELMHTLFLKNHHHHHEPTQNGQAKAENHSRGLSLRQYGQTDKSGQEIFNESHPISNRQSSCYNACEQSDSNGNRVNNCDVENLNNLENIIQEDRSIYARVFDALLMILAFSCHAIFDGISIGVQTGSKIWTVLIAILAHKLLVAFILAVQIHERCFQTLKSSEHPDQPPQSKPIKRAKPILWLFSTLFAAMSPIGIFIVMAMDNSSDAPVEKALHIIVLSAISAGTIIYIVFLEIIDKSSSRTHISGLVQWIALVLGFGAMYLVSSLFKEE